MSVAESIPEQIVRQIPPPQRNVGRKTAAGMLRGAFSWLHKNYVPTAKKQLRVSETVSLGEKRFVAIIHVEGQKFLIGGGSTGVSLLTQLGEREQSTNPRLSIHELAERSA